MEQNSEARLSYFDNDGVDGMTAGNALTYRIQNTILECHAQQSLSIHVAVFREREASGEHFLGKFRDAVNNPDSSV